MKYWKLKFLVAMVLVGTGFLVLLCLLAYFIPGFKEVIVIIGIIAFWFYFTDFSITLDSLETYWRRKHKDSQDKEANP